MTAPILDLPLAAPTQLRTAITAAWLRDEGEHVASLLPAAELPADRLERATATAIDLIRRVRRHAEQQDAIEAFMREYDLSSEEGVLLMCVAEALLRIPDQATADRLIRDKLGDANWGAHSGASDSMLVNASTWGLMLTGRLVNLSESTRVDVGGAMSRIVGRIGEPLVRLAVRQAMRIMGHQFVMGRTIHEALARARRGANAQYRYSFDMLGEAALTADDAKRYFKAYADAIDAIGGRGPHPDVFAAPSISVKLSALHPRYEHAKRQRVLAELVPRVADLAARAAGLGIGFTMDAEEADRLELSLDVFDAVMADSRLAEWPGFGLAVQAYLKRAPFVIDQIAALARQHGQRIPLRLVKGAYWDAEIKHAQADGLAGFPVFTRKPNTDVSYQACARRMLEAIDAIYPMFATHNAQTIAAVIELADASGVARGTAAAPYEFQRLHGMGEDLYQEVIGADRLAVPCRVYAPVGSHEDLLPYLVRRLLENGANSSFVNRITDEAIEPAVLAADPVATVRSFAAAAHPRIPLPRDLFPGRSNSMGINLADRQALEALATAVQSVAFPRQVTPRVPGAKASSATDVSVTNPADRRQILGSWTPADPATIDLAFANASAAQPAWDALPAASRAKLLEHAADLLESRTAEFVALCVREAGKTIPASISEVREAVDFLRYYALGARELFAAEPLPGPTGESNILSLHGRGIFVCISPWNFPLAIFTGQIAAALVAGNAVLAKPAEQTNLVADAAVALLHEAGVPAAVLQMLPGDGREVGARLVEDPRTAGVCFTGSTATARAINRSMAGRDAPIGTLIAETGGQNALIADSSALPEQLVRDALAGAFDSAGQRCSATRVLFVQTDIADRVIEMIGGAMAELAVGDPGQLATDVGPVIDAPARSALCAHADAMRNQYRLIHETPLPESTRHGSFVAPLAVEIPSIDVLEREQFGPILHVVRFAEAELDKVVDHINATGYGLTLGIHSRIDETVDRIVSRARVGNIYVNRNQIGAVVGSQPFGGEGLSGTGPKAGGPHYLARFATERTVTVNTTAAGGNASLLTLGE